MKYCENTIQKWNRMLMKRCQILHWHNQEMFLIKMVEWSVLSLYHQEGNWCWRKTNWRIVDKWNNCIERNRRLSQSVVDWFWHVSIIIHQLQSSEWNWRNLIHSVLFLTFLFPRYYTKVPLIFIHFSLFPIVRFFGFSYDWIFFPLTES